MAAQKDENKISQALREASIKRDLKRLEELSKKRELYNNYKMMDLPEEAKKSLESSIDSMIQKVDAKIQNLSEIVQQKASGEYKNKKDIIIDKVTQAVKDRTGALVHTLSTKFQDAYEAFKEACEKLGHTPETIKNNAKDYAKALTDPRKVRKSIEATMATFNSGRDTARFEKEFALSQIELNQKDIANMESKLQSIASKANLQNERSYHWANFKESVRGLFGVGQTKKGYINRSEFNWELKQPYKDQVKELNDLIHGKIQENINLAKDVAQKDIDAFEKESTTIFFEKPKDIDASTFYKATGQIRDALVKNAEYDLSPYEQMMADGTDQPVFDTAQLYQIYNGMEDGVNIDKYADPAISAEKMNVVRAAMNHNYDVNLTKKQLKTMSVYEIIKAVEPKEKETYLNHVKNITAGDVDIASDIKEYQNMVAEVNALSSPELAKEQEEIMAQIAKTVNEELNRQAKENQKENDKEEINIDEKMLQYEDLGFSEEQLEVIREGYEAGLTDDDLQTYATPDLDPDAMRGIKKEVLKEKNLANEEITPDDDAR